jgi:N4-gp56 family major capsid protein
MKETIKELATGRTVNADIRGSSDTTYRLEPTVWLKQIVDAAKQQQYFMQTCYVTQTQKGQTDLVIPKRTKYMGSTGITYATDAAADGTKITATRVDTSEGVRLRPTVQASRVTIANDQIRTNALDVMKYAQDELIYSIGEKIDIAIATKIGDANSCTSALSGAQILYGGDATSDTTLAAGDVITTDLVAKARRLLMSKNKQYRATAAGTGGGYGALTGTVAGNPWTSSPDMPFVLYIGPAQQEAFLTDSQFTNAAEFGGRGPILNGEIPGYLGIRIVVTNNVEQVASGSEGPDEETANAGATMTRCILLKAQKACAFCWGLKPKLSFFNNIPEISQEIVLESAYDIEIIHHDAIVFIDVADA